MGLAWYIINTNLNVNPCCFTVHQIAIIVFQILIKGIWRYCWHTRCGGNKPDYGNYTIRFNWRDFTKLFILSDKHFLVLLIHFLSSHAGYVNLVTKTFIYYSNRVLQQICEGRHYPFKEWIYKNKNYFSLSTFPAEHISWLLCMCHK